ncbi:hypothetical protein NQ315_017522 [Exocentrus adspersus]|uniref:Golgi apparatus membrane protein TVP23 homolog n=1 Tax=Exocentrus adspersus TaxID=1586481 RepID=A0AAV8VKS8_9CUCU|nr:hypothetical protein NQ315_017522 [Exocentrus adspersus]
MSSVTMPLLDDDTIAFGEEDINVKNKYSLTGASIVIYMLCGWFSDSFIASFVTVILFLSMDFWTVKNITGRLMVGLRWWNYVDDDGKSHWVFESRKGSSQNRINEREVRIFWTALILTPLIWSVFFLIALFGFKLKWLLLVIIALVLNGSNLYGYIKCRVGGSENLSSITSDFLRKQVLQNAVSLVTRQTMPTTTPINPTGQPVNTV